MFQLSPKSFHAVTPIKSEVPRYSLIFTFKLSKRLFEKEVWEKWYPFPLKSDLDEARYNAEMMNIEPTTLDNPYICKEFSGLESFLEFFSERLDGR